MCVYIVCVYSMYSVYVSMCVVIYVYVYVYMCMCVYGYTQEIYIDMGI